MTRLDAATQVARAVEHALHQAGQFIGKGDLFESGEWMQRALAGIEQLELGSARKELTAYYQLVRSCGLMRQKQRAIAEELKASLSMQGAPDCNRCGRPWSEHKHTPLSAYASQCPRGATESTAPLDVAEVHAMEELQEETVSHIKRADFFAAGIAYERLCTHVMGLPDRHRVPRLAPLKVMHDGAQQAQRALLGTVVEPSKGQPS